MATNRTASNRPTIQQALAGAALSGACVLMAAAQDLCPARTCTKSLIAAQDRACWTDRLVVEMEIAAEHGGKQPGAVLIECENGGFLAAWVRPRAKDRQTGIFVRRFDALGRPLTEPARVTTYSVPLQSRPSISSDSDGVWTAWVSPGQDGSAGAIVARRMSPDISGPLTDEIPVNEQTIGEQVNPVVVATADGGALIAWQSENRDPGNGMPTTSIRVRAFDRDGAPLGPEDVVAESLSARDTLPSMERLSDGSILLTWARRTAVLDDSEVMAIRLNDRGTPLSEATSLTGNAASDQIEPAVAGLPDGGFVAGWLTRNGDGYDVIVRRFNHAMYPAGDARVIASASTGWKSGVDVAAGPSGQWLVAFNSDGETGDRGEIYAQRFDSNGLAIDPAPVQVNTFSKGPQELNPATGSKRVAWNEDDVLAFAWCGHREEGVANGESAVTTHQAGEVRACLTLLAPRNLEVVPHVAMAVGSVSEPMNAPAIGEDSPADQGLALAAKVSESTLQTRSESGADSPIPPLKDPNWTQQDPWLEPAEGPDFGFEGVPGTAWYPPDPHMAVGPANIVLMTNGQIAFFNKDGTNTFRDEIEDSFGFWGSLGATNFVFDPEVVYDLHSGRFVAMACERAGSFNAKSYFLLAISDDSDPNGTWHKYRLDVTTQAGGGDIDSPNLATDRDYIWLSADHFSPDKYPVYAIDKSSVINGGTPVVYYERITGSHSYGIPMTYDADAPAQYLLQSTEFTNNNTVIFHAIRNPASGWTRTTHTLSVPAYTYPNQPPQKGTSGRPFLFEPRFWSCVYRNGSLWACHHVNSTRARVRWYEFSMNGWPTSGQTPTVRQWGEIDLGGSIHTYFCSIGVDAEGNAALTYARSSPDEYISMSRSIRLASDPLNTFRESAISKESLGYSNGGRWGDYSATVEDPVDPGYFWGHHEWTSVNTTSGWRTWVARYELPSRLQLSVSPLFAGQNGTVSVTGGNPNAAVYFLYSLRGEGSTFIPQLNVTVDLDRPQLLGQATTDANGEAALTRPVPGAAQGRLVWVQAAQSEIKSNLVLTQVN